MHLKRHWNVHVYKTSDGKEHDPYDVGRNGTVEDFRKAWQTANGKTDNWGLFCGAKDQIEMLHGARDAFKAGQPANMQDVFLAPSNYQSRHTFYDVDACRHEQANLLIDGADDPVGTLKLALEKIEPETRQSVLDTMLANTATENDVSNPDLLMASLLALGADANTAGDGEFKGLVLASVARNSRPEAIVKTLYECGASFDDAKFLMEAQNWNSDAIDQLDAYRKKITGVSDIPAPANNGNDEDLRAIVLSLRDEVQKLTREVRSLKEKPAEDSAPKPPVRRRPPSSRSPL